MTDPRLLDWGGSGCAIREIAAYGARRAAEIGAENVYNFSIGSPSIDPPPCVGEAIERLLHTVPPTLLHAYAPAQGLPEVREAVAAYLNRTFAMDYRAEDIFMTDGASAALSVLARALLSPGDEAVALAPFFSEYRVFAEQTGAALRVAPCLPDSFQPDLAALESAVTPRTALVILNSPNNPSGVVYTRESLAAVCALLERREREYRHPIYLLADEPYRELVYGGAEVPFLPAMYADAVYCYSFSKSLSLPGERVGFLALAPRAAEHDAVMTAVAGAYRAQGYICVSSLFQRVAAACLGKTADLSAYAENRDLIYGALTELGFSCAKPDGAFYLFLRSPEPDSRAFCRRAMAHDILLVPGDDFACPGYARLAYCVAKDTIARSIPAFRALSDEYRLT